MIAEAMEKLRDLVIGGMPKVFEHPNKHGGKSVKVALPSGYSVYTLDETKQRPETVQQVVVFDELESFARYVVQFGSSETTLFIQHKQTSISMEAVMDYHDSSLGAGAALVPNWCSHRAEFQPVVTAEWRTWTENTKRQMEQVKFAEFLEDNRLDVAEPTGGALVELCRNFEAKQSVTYKKAYREKDGTLQFQFTTDNGPIEKMGVPDSIILRIAPYQGEALQDVVAKIRYRLTDGRCLFYYELERPHKVMEASAKAMREQLHELTQELAPAIYSGVRG